MKTYKLLAAIGGLILISGSVLAGNNTLTLTNDTGAVGATLSTETAWTQGASDAGFQFDIAYDNAALSFDSCDPNFGAYNPGEHIFSCVTVGPVVRVVIANTLANPIASGSPFTVNFTANGPPGTYPLTITNGVFVTPTDLTNGQFEVLGASYDSANPAPNTPVNFGTHTAGDTDVSQLMTIDNDGEAGTTLNGSCLFNGTTPGDPPFFTINNTFTVDEAGPNHDVTIGCEVSTATPGMYSTELHCTHDGDSSPASPVIYPLTCNIVAAPSPEYGSTPAPGAAFNFGTLTTADPSADLPLTIENVGNLDGLDGSCSISSNPNSAYSIDDAGAYGPLAQAATAGRVVTCDSSVLGDHTGGVLSCTHNGSILATPVTYPLNCVVEPTPTYDSTPAPGNPLAAMNGIEGNADPTSMLMIDNVGEAGSTLTGTCGVTGDPQLSITGSNAFSVDEGGASGQIAVACDATAQGSYTGTLSCTADPNTSNPGPHTYALDCTIGPPDPGMFGSTPASGGVVDLTPGGPVVEGTDLTNAGQLLVRNTGEVGDENIDYTCSITGGSPEITQSPSPSAGSLVAGDPDTVINYSCNTAADGAFSATVECVWSAPLEGVGGTENYTVNCDVRDPFTEVVESPPSGTPQTADLMPGESTVFSFDFTEIVDEGGDASLDDCVLATGTDFAITAPGGFPQPIPSGSTVTVDVTFTDPGVGDTFSDTLSCAATHQPPPTGGEGAEYFVSWPLEVSVVGRNATVRVTKDFSDDNPAGVEVFMECNTGLPLQQSGTIYDPDSGPGPGQFTFIDFVVVDFAPGTMDCDVFETVPAGYEASYFADIGANGVAGSITSDEEGCHYDDIESADFICEITNDLLPVDVVVEKEWIDEHPEYQLPTVVEITLVCSDPIVDGFGCLGINGGNGTYCATRFIDPNNPGEFQVFPHYEGTVCSATEELEAGVVADQTDCEEMILLPGQGDSCVIVNTRLFAGIPTLSQYGLILMALLMLGVGAVAFRRYS